MDIKRRSYETITLEFGSLEVKVDGTLSARVAPLLREEYPEKQEPEGAYIAFDRNKRKLMAIDKDSVTVRDDLVSTPRETFSLFVRTLSGLRDVVHWQAGDLRVETGGEIPLESEQALKAIMSTNLLPRGIDADSLPGAPALIGTVMGFHMDDCHRQISLDARWNDDGPQLAFELVTWKDAPVDLENLTRIYDSHFVSLDQILELIHHW